MSAQPTLEGIARAGVGDTRDELDRHFTPVPLAKIVVEAVGNVCQAVLGRAPRLIVEPSVGSGNMVRAARERWPEARIFGVDVDPHAEGRRLVDEFVEHDWLTLDWTPNSMDCIVGNPPFTGRTGVAHVQRCLEVASVVGLILPWECMGGGRNDEYWEPLMHGQKAPLYARPVMGPRPWSHSVRQATLFIWVQEHLLTASAIETRPRVRPLPRWKP